MTVKPRAGIESISPYIGGRAKTGGPTRVVKLSANETPLGASPRAIAAYHEAGNALHRYPDGGSTLLREAIAKRHGLEADQIVCGNGSDELFHLIAQAYLGPGDEILHSAHGFLVYPIAARAAGADVVVVPEPNLRIDVDALLERVGPRTRIVMIANPNNPTGTYLSAGEVMRLREGLPQDVLLVLDGAYAEYVQRNDFTTGEALVRGSDNVVMTRTFSKAYGLAGLRIGWAYCPGDVAQTLNRIRSPFNLSIPAQHAAVAALADEAHLAQAVAHNAKWRAWLEREIAALGLTVVPSVGNFVLIQFPHLPGRTAGEADAYLTARGLLLRQVASYGLPDCLRLTVGLEEDNVAVVTALRAFLGGAA